MKKIFLSTQIPDDKTAASKAKVDVLEILEKEGYHTVYFPPITGVSAARKFWKTLSRLVIPGETHLILEYPCMPLKRISLVYLFCRMKRVKLYGVIHDIGALRFGWPDQKDMLFLKMFDGLVSHNASMTAWLRQKGYKKKIADLDVFDYCLADAKNFHADSAGQPIKIFYAGNLAHKKAGYLYEKGMEQLDNVELCVYGQYFEQERLNGAARINYKGVFNPNTPDLAENYHFGLIWEGSSLDTCDGLFGNYIRYNNPHKFSLYLSLGLPVIVWKEAAIAPFILKNNIGFAIGSFHELEGIGKWITDDQYRTYTKNVESFADKVRNGFFLKTALNELIKS
ncbi:MAG: hypothetical protein JNL51_16550 [Chitinophagaceae bacterium]|nr:hypothetical protein [Chitinophagaceae bacterium]